jgi:Tfp pilus assembly protein PilF
LRPALAPLAVLGALLCAPAAAASPEEPASLPPVQLRELHYGDTLFHFFQDDYFEAIVRTEAYRAQGHLRAHADDAELLLGGLYLSFGQHTRATEIFRRLLNRESTPPGVRDRAWFHLGKVLYARGYYEESDQALRTAGDSLPGELAAERRLLLAQGLMYRGRYDEAVAELDGWTGPADWQAYGQFNLGVALVRAGRTQQGFALLDAAGQLAPTTEEMRALRDKANVALGYARLQAGEPGSARVALERVRLNGPQSSKALLGAGWAEFAEKRYADALAPWTELHGRGLLDAAVQESYLAVPYAYARLAADRQAAEYYENAISAYGAESRRLDESIGAIRSGRMLEAVLASDRGGGEGWFWQLSTLPDAPESRYLYHLLAGHEFQEALKHYRALDFLEGNLARWSENLAVFGHMLETRRQAFELRVPAAAERLQAVDIESLDASRDALHARLDGALRSGDWAALATGDELRTLDLIEGVEAELAAGADDPALADARDKARLARGVMTWRLEAAGKERAWRTRSSLRQLDAQLFDARTRYRAVVEALGTVPQRNAQFARRIEAIAPRVEGLGTRVAAARTRQGEYLAALAVEELEAQKARLAEYSVQARYALATLYDRATVAVAAPAAGGRP